MPYVYLLECADGSYYAGWTCDLEGRLIAHNGGKASRYTRSRRPVRLVYSEKVADRGAALKREASLKRLSRVEKRSLITQCSTMMDVNS